MLLFNEKKEWRGMRSLLNLEGILGNLEVCPHSRDV